MPSPDVKPSKSLSSQLVDSLIGRIHEEKLGPGSLLGTELQLAEHHGVSRTVVREAIGALRGLGVVSSRQGSGVFVAESDIRPILSKVFYHTAANEKGWRELASFRVVVEMGVLLLAVQNVSDEQVKRLRLLAAEMRAMVENAEGDPFGLRHAFLDKEMLFHGTLLEATGSEFAAQLHQTLAEYFRQSEKFLSLPDLRIVKEHEAIAEAVARRDIGEAARVMSAHLSPIVEVVQAHQPRKAAAD